MQDSCERNCLLNESLHNALNDTLNTSTSRWQWQHIRFSSFFSADSSAHEIGACNSYIGRQSRGFDAQKYFALCLKWKSTSHKLDVNAPCGHIGIPLHSSEIQRVSSVLPWQTRSLRISMACNISTATAARMVCWNPRNHPALQRPQKIVSFWINSFARNSECEIDLLFFGAEALRASSILVLSIMYLTLVRTRSTNQYIHGPDSNAHTTSGCDETSSSKRWNHLHSDLARMGQWAIKCAIIYPKCGTCSLRIIDDPEYREREKREREREREREQHPFYCSTLTISITGTCLEKITLHLVVSCILQLCKLFRIWWAHVLFIVFKYYQYSVNHQ